MAGESKVQLEASLSVEKLVKDLQAARTEADRLRNELAETNKKIKEGFDQSAGAAGKMGSELKDALSRIESQRETIRSLRTELENYQKTAAKGFDDGKVEAYKNKIVQLEKELSQLREQATQTGKEVEAANNKGIRSVDALKQKLAAAKAEQRALRDEVSNYTRLIRETERETKRLEKEIDKQNITTAEGRTRVSELRQEIKLLNQDGVHLENALKNSRARLDEVSQSVRTYTREVRQAERSNASGLFNRIGQSLKSLVNYIPGLGLAGFIAMITGPLISGLKEWFSNLRNVEDKQKLLNETLTKARSVYVDAVVQVNDMKEKIRLAKDGVIDKEDVVKHYNETIGKTTGLVKDLTEAEQNLIDKGDAYVKMMFFMAAANAALAQAAGEALKAEETRRKKLSEFSNVFRDTRVVAFGSTSFNAREFEQDQKRREAAQAAAREKEAKEQEKHAQNLQNIAKKFMDDAAKIAKENQLNILGTNLEQQKKEEEEKRKREAAQRKAEAERLKALREEEARLQRIVELERQLASLRVELMDAGRARDIAAENVRFETAIRSLEVMKKASKTSAEEIKLIDQIIEAQKQLHRKNLLAIDKKYIEEAEKIMESAQRTVGDLLMSGREKDLSDLEERFQRAIDSIKQARDKLLNDAPDSPLIRGFITGMAETQIQNLMEGMRKARAEINKQWDLKEIEQQEQLAQALNDILQVQGLSQEKLTRLREVNSLNITIEFAREKLKVLRASGEEANKLQIAQLEKVIQDAEAKLKGLSSNAELDLFEFLGINQETAGRIKSVANAISTFGQVASDVFDPLVQAANRRINAIQRLIDKIDEQISKQEEAVNREKELAEQGYANNLSIEQRKLADLRQQKAQQLEEERKAHEAKKTLLRAQLIADTVAQTSNLVTSATDIFKALAKLGPIGVGLAVISIGAMLAAFITAKAQAFKAVGDVPTFRKGGGVLLDGASHEEGGIKLVDSKTGEVKGEAERNEYGYFFREGKKVKQKYEPLLDAINKDELSTWTYEDLKKFIQPTPIELPKEKYRHLVARSETMRIIEKESTPTSAPRLLLERIADSNEKLLQLEMNREEIHELPDKTIYKKGNLTRIIHKDKNAGTV